ncbi:MAG: Fic family protein [Phycisphaerae bacterium]|nr:Fic family protein [Phycisphaerae bacterium]
MTYNRPGPYNDLPLLPPKVDIESKQILKRCITARSSLAALKQAAELIPNPTVLINTIPLLEAKVSSEIENIVTTTDKLFQFASGNAQNADHATKETLRYRQALYQGYQSIRQRPVCTSVAIDVCRTIRDIQVDVRKVPGTALANDRTGEVIYTPPTGEGIIRDKLANWEKFVNENKDIDPLIRMAIMHYQFEAIHPFTDGNGRTGRILNLLLLIQEGLLDIPVLYLSRYFINNKNQYYALLRGVTENENWQGWILYVLDAVAETAQWTTNKIKTAQELLLHTCDYINQKSPKVYSRELVETIFEQPYCRISNIVDKGIAKRQTASTYLKKLVEINVLKEMDAGREKIYINPKFFMLLTQDENSYEPFSLR